MSKVLKWFGIIVAGLVGVILVVAVVAFITANARLERTYQVDVELVPLPVDSASIQEGERLAQFYCTGCHGENLAGTDFFAIPPLGVVDATNLTAGEGGIGVAFSDEDFIRAIRHGIDPEGNPLFVMPSKDFYYLNDEDLGQIIAYLRTLEPVDGVYNDKNFTILGRVMFGLGMFGDVLNAETIDHAAPRPLAPEPGVTVDYGQYLVTTFGCTSCHGAELSGGRHPEPGGPNGSNLTPAGSIGGWSADDFITILRTRESDWMPYESLAKMSDDELKAVFQYLQSLPALETTP